MGEIIIHLIGRWQVFFLLEGITSHFRHPPIQVCILVTELHNFIYVILSINIISKYCSIFLELQIAPVGTDGRHSIYWHLDARSEDDIRVPIEECEFRFTVKPSLMEVVQAINPGQSLIPEWVHQGAILGVQGGTKRMLDILNQVAYIYIYIYNIATNIADH